MVYPVRSKKLVLRDSKDSGEARYLKIAWVFVFSDLGWRFPLTGEIRWSILKTLLYYFPQEGEH